MTKSTITRERLEQLADNNTICKVSWDERIELAQIALATMDSEPVAWTDEEELRDVNVAGIGYLFGIDREANKFSDPRRQIMLYRHAQPAPVVPESISVRQAISALESADAVTTIGQAYKLGWNACRAAMFQAEPQNAQQNIPEIIPGWIPVSEQMPEDEQEVLTRNRMGHRFVSFFDKHSGLFFDRIDAPAACCIEHVLVTHWMPLPAAQQEVNHG
ncbi:TPA: DUF551 domain-containing protein [Klebsiella quasipneumoniae]